jgi:hypothetical protein
LKILVDREDIVTLSELLHVLDLGGPPKLPHPASINQARRILNKILDNNPVDEQGLAV